jgi:signal peptidase I
MNRVFRALAWIAGFLLVAGLIARATVLDSWVVPDDPKTGAAVAPTLAGGDTILYMYRNQPQFGDLVRCKDPDDGTRWVVGRVVGLFGDTVEVNGRDLTVNNKRYTGEMACAEERIQIPHPTAGSTVEIVCDQVQIAGHPHFRGGALDKATVVQPLKKTVGEGMLFLLSDDRSYHDDSRDFGPVKADTCSGRIVFRLWSKEGWADSRHRMTFVQ